MNDNKYLSIDDDKQMYSKLNEKSELERFRNRHSDEELGEFVDKYADLWRPAFKRNHAKFGDEADGYPLHPWKVLKKARAEYAEEENDGDWPDMDKRHALRVVKDEYAEKWRAEAYSEDTD